MGVPKLFRTLLNKYHGSQSDSKNYIITPKINEGIENLFFDLNCLIHPVCAQCGSNTRIMFEKISEYIDVVVAYVSPYSKVFLFMDGVAPLAKIQQQRQRRYKSLYLKKMRQDLEEKYRVPASEMWDSNQISPETKFMLDLEDYLRQKYPKYMISGTKLPGEGEHKIIEYVLSQKFENICIYGLDADLILLSWIIYLKKDINVYLIRETQTFENTKVPPENPFTFMIISKLVDTFYTNLNLFGNKNIDCSDFIFLTFFLGNDFLPNLFGLHLGMKPDGLTILLDTYIECRKMSPAFSLLNLKSNSVIVWRNFWIFFELLHRKQVQIYDRFLKSYESYRPRPAHSVCDSKVDRAMYEFENMHKKSDPLCMRSAGWENRFVKRYFGIEDTSCTFELNNIINQYLSGLVWNIKYYFKTDSQISFGYIYPYMMSPTIDMIYKKFNNGAYDAQGDNSFISYDHFVNSQFCPIHPVQGRAALKLILPPESLKLIYTQDTKAQSTVSKDAGKYAGTIDFSESNIHQLEYFMDYKHFWNECFLRLPPIEWK
jgi:5'-3' exonuclease